jgi:NAD(P)-dependent dehydrogenase (short-subunit alcohol dehydrogenase family)
MRAPATIAVKTASEHATERVAILMSPSEKAVFTGKAKTMGLSLGQLFREAGAAYAAVPSVNEADHEVLEVALRQLELSTARTEQALDQALEQVRAALQA